MQKASQTDIFSSKTDVMTLSVFLLMPLLLSGFGAQADDERTSIARQIEQESETMFILGDDQSGNFDLYPALGFRNYMLVSGCDVTAEIEENSPKGERVYGLTFDLARTRLPHPNDESSQQWGVRDLGEHGKQGVIGFEFVAPYAPTQHGTFPERWPKTPMQRYNFLMEEMTDDEQPRRLLALLNQYQNEYCSFSG